MIKIAMIGTGKISNNHLVRISSIEGVELCAVCDVNEDRAKEVAEKYGVPYFLDYKEIPEKCDANAVIITLPHGLHCESTVFFLEKGLDVLLEKPMANTVEECDRMIDAANRTGRKLAIGHSTRFTGAYTQAKKLIDSGELGQLCMVDQIRTCDYFEDSRPRWFLSKAMAGGGIMMNLGAHVLDALFYLTGARPDIIVSNVANIGDKKDQFDVEGHAQFFVKLDNGVSANVTLSGYSNSSYETNFIFTRGAAKITNRGLLFVKRGAQDWEDIEAAKYVDTFGMQLAAFVKYVNGEPSKITTAQEGRDVIAAIQKVYESSAED